MCCTHECNATDTGHDTPSRHTIQPRGQPVVVLSIGVERHTGIHDPIVKSFPDVPHTPADAQLDDVMVVVSRKLGRKCTVQIES